jgi:hypothetical protein
LSENSERCIVNINMGIILEISKNMGESRPFGPVFTLGTANSACSAAFCARISGIRENPVKYTDPDGRQIVEVITEIGPLLGTMTVILSAPKNAKTVGDSAEALWDGFDKAGEATMAASDAIKSQVASIFAKVPVRDKDRNPMPAGNRQQSPMGKKANSGPMDIGDPGDLGGPKFRSPGPKDVLKKIAALLTIGGAGQAIIRDGYNNPSASAPAPEPDADVPTIMNPLIYSEPSFSAKYEKLGE